MNLPCRGRDNDCNHRCHNQSERREHPSQSLPNRFARGQWVLVASLPGFRFLVGLLLFKLRLSLFAFFGKLPAFQFLLLPFASERLRFADQPTQQISFSNGWFRRGFVSRSCWFVGSGFCQCQLIRFRLRFRFGNQLWLRRWRARIDVCGKHEQWFTALFANDLLITRYPQPNCAFTTTTQYFVLLWLGRPFLRLLASGVNSREPTGHANQSRSGKLQRKYNSIRWKPPIGSAHHELNRIRSSALRTVGATDNTEDG